MWQRKSGKYNKRDTTDTLSAKDAYKLTQQKKNGLKNYRCLILILLFFLLILKCSGSSETSNSTLLAVATVFGARGFVPVVRLIALL